MKSYGMFDSSWTHDKVRSMLEEGWKMARDSNTSFRVGEDKDANIVIVPNSGEEDVHIFACGITKPEITDGLRENFPQNEIEKRMKSMFWDNTAYHNYTIDEMVPKVYDCLNRGIITYGSLRFLSEGRMQLARSLSDAHRMVKKFDAPFVLGYAKERQIMLAPLSEMTKFIDMIACVVGRHGHWSISDMRSCNLKGQFGMDPVTMIYSSIVYHEKRYGMFTTEYNRCAIALESAVEDAMKFVMQDNNPMNLVLDRYGTIRIQRNKITEEYGLDTETFRIDPKAVTDGSSRLPLPDRVKSVARKAHCKFLPKYEKIRQRPRFYDEQNFSDSLHGMDKGLKSFLK